MSCILAPVHGGGLDPEFVWSAGVAETLLSQDAVDQTMNWVLV